MAFKMKGYSAFTKDKKFFGEKHREIEPDREGGLTPTSVISTETVSKEKRDKLKKFMKITDEKTGEVKYVKRKQKKGKPDKEKEISEKRFLSKKKRYEKKKGYQTHDYSGRRTKREQFGAKKGTI